MTPKRMGFTCAYTPVPIIEAAGYLPFRVFPSEESPDQAGQLLHDNLCPHVKRVLDRALANDLPDLDGMVFMNSCDAMRRLADAWHLARPRDRVLLLDLPSSITDSNVAFLADEYRRMAGTLCDWNGDPDPSGSGMHDRLTHAVAHWNRLAEQVRILENRLPEAFYPGLAPAILTAITAAATQSVARATELAGETLARTFTPASGGAPVYLFGNLLFDPSLVERFEDWNMHITGMDFCTGSRFVTPVPSLGSGDLFLDLAAGFMKRPPCARTMDPAFPGHAAAAILSRAKQTRARGVMGLTLKFCDPYLARTPLIRQQLQRESLPLLILESDCTTGAAEQHRTRIEAFTEMLGGDR